MLEKLNDMPAGIDGLKATGKVSKEDYEAVVEPLLESAWVALAADSKLASLIPHIAEHFVEAEIKSFRFDELDDAIAWARGSGEQKAAGRVSAVETRA